MGGRLKGKVGQKGDEIAKGLVPVRFTLSPYLSPNLSPNLSPTLSPYLSDILSP